MSFSVKVAGVEEAVAGLRGAGVRYADALRAAAFVWLGEVVTATEPEIPVRTGELRESGFVERTSPASGGFGAEHAELIHERDGRGWKFLQRAFNQRASGAEVRMAELTAELAAQGATLETARAAHPEVPRLRARPRGLGRARR